MIFIFETCRDLIRTLPMMQHDDTIQKTWTATVKTTRSMKLAMLS